MRKKNSEGIRRVSSGSLHSDVVSCQGEGLRGSVSCWFAYVNITIFIRDDRKQNCSLSFRDLRLKLENHMYDDLPFPSLH